MAHVIGAPAPLPPSPDDEDPEVGGGRRRTGSAVEAACDIEAKLNEARVAQGRLAKARLVLAFLWAAGTCTAWELLRLSDATGDATTRWLADLCNALALFCMVFVIMPNDRWLPMVGSIFVTARCIWCPLRQVYAIRHLLHGPCHMHEKLAAPCYIRDLELIADVSCLLIHVADGIFVFLALFSQPRRTLNRVLLVVSVMLCGKGCISLLHGITAELARREGVPIAGDEVANWVTSFLYLFGLGLLVSWPRFRSRVRFFLRSYGGDLRSASSIAAYIAHEPSDKIIEKAQKSCRYISLDLVTEADMQKSTPDPTLQQLSSLGRLEDIDAFLSHSWHDPPAEKWAKLQQWRQQFKADMHREPRLWIDKYCLDQNDIRSSLTCLPVYLAGCQRLLVLAGPTYLTRLWCVVELFIFLKMSRGFASVDLEELCPGVWDLVEKFDVADARCHLDSDQQALLGAIEAGCCSYKEFNEAVRDLLLQCRQRSWRPSWTWHSNPSEGRSSDAASHVGPTVSATRSMSTAASLGPREQEEEVPSTSGTAKKMETGAVSVSV